VTSPPPVSAPGVQAALVRVRHRIDAAGGDPAKVTVVAVTKGHSPEAVSAALEAGLTEVGENYASELVAKASALGPAGSGSRDQPAGGEKPGGTRLRWHFLGEIQRNKVASLAPVVSVWETVDRPEEAATIARNHTLSGRPGRAKVMVQVRLAGEGNRGGCPPAAVEELVERCRELTDVIGLMAVGPPGPPDAARPGFRWLAATAARLGLAELSMGMSDDLEVAVAEGATMVRIGTALFGPRFERPDLGR
jgi:PLP dependent protein